MCHLNFCLTLLSVVTQTNKQTGVGGGGVAEYSTRLYIGRLRPKAQTLKLVVYHFWPKKFLSLV